jgi:hypothetical protein
MFLYEPFYRIALNNTSENSYPFPSGMLYYSSIDAGLVVGMTGFNLSGKEQTNFLIRIFPYQIDYPLPQSKAIKVSRASKVSISI